MEKEENRKQLMSYIVYSLYSVALVVYGIASGWQSWIYPCLLFGVLSCIGVNILHGRGRRGTHIWLTLMIWMDLAIHVYCNQNLTAILPIIMVFSVLLSVFDVLIIHYIFIAATALFFLLNIAGFYGADLRNDIGNWSLAIQPLSVLLLEFVELNHSRARISQSRQLKNTMRELTSAEHGKMDFMANVSHELRTPLNTIYGTSTSLLSEEMSPRMQEFVRDIHIASRHLITLVSDILDFTDLENGTVNIVEEPYNIASVVNDVINMAQAWNEGKNLEIIVDCDAQIPSGLSGDSQKIYRVMLNIVNNAIKFTHDGGIKITLKARQENYGINLGIDVEDTGIGMKEADLDKMDMVYNQVDTRRDRQAGGIGLGFAISRMMVARMNGFMHIESVYGEGTKVSIVLPQKVVSREPICSVKDAEHKTILCYIDLAKYKNGKIRDGFLECIENMITGLRVNALRCATMEELKRRVQKGKFQYIFTASLEYRREKAYFDNLLAQMEIIVIVENDEEILDIADGIKIIRKPSLHAIAVASVLNGSSVQRHLLADQRESFCAPAARILVVDDVVMNIKVVANLLARYKINIDKALSGKEALEKVKQNDYDLVFMDHMMPEMDGVQALHAIRAMPGEYLKTMPVVALTANAVGGAREILLQEGFDDFVAKPIEHSTMERVLRKFLSDKIVDASAVDIVPEKTANMGSEHMDLLQPESGMKSETGLEIAQKAELKPEPEKELDPGSKLESKIEPESESQLKLEPEKSEIKPEPELEPEAESGQQPDVVNDKQVEKALFNIPELNVKTGLMFCGDDLECYIEILQDFVESATMHLTSMKEAWEKREMEQYTIDVHSVKGMAATIGADSVSEMAKELQYASQENRLDFVETHEEPLRTALSQLLSRLASALRGTEEGLGGEKDV